MDQWYDVVIWARVSFIVTAINHDGLVNRDVTPLC